MNQVIIMDDEPQVFSEVHARLSVSLGESHCDTEDAGHQAGPKLLFVWLSPAFPVGSFAFSHGLEWAVHAGRVHDATSTASWLEALIEHGSARNDAIFAASAWRATEARDGSALRHVGELAMAMAGSRERHLETAAQGNAFIAIIRDAWNAPRVEWARQNVKGDVAYPVAVAVASSAHSIALGDMLHAFSLAQMLNLISSAIRLSVIGHTDGQRVIAALLPAIGRLASFAASATLEDLGGAAFQSDIAALCHETQYSRLFRS